MNKKEEALNTTKDFWKSFYAKHNLRHTPSPFASWCIDNYVKPTDKVFEVGCGNGRDSFAFLANGNDIFAIDGCDVAIQDNKKYLSSLSFNSTCKFNSVDFNNLDDFSTLNNIEFEKYNVFYSRFVLHAIPEILEDKVLEFIHKSLDENGMMLHEFRTNKDPLSKEGTMLSENERLTDHYRRFIDTKHFRTKVKALGFKELYFEENDNLAVFGDDNPVVARIVLVK